MLPRLRRRRLRALPLFGALLWACGGGGATDTKVPGTISVTPTAVTLDAVGQTRQLTPVVTDQDGGTIASPSVTWASDNTAVATVTGSGLVSAAGAGTAHITAIAGSVNASVGVTVTQTPTQLQKVAGDQQTANVGQTVPTPLSIQVNDATGHPIPGVTVVFTVDPAFGTLGTPTALTGADGRAATSLTIIGAGSFGVEASAQGTSLTTSFSETGASPFTIDVRYVTNSPSVSPTDAQKQAFDAARQRWEGLIVGDVPNVRLTIKAGDCFPNTPAVDETIDDLLIFVILEPIDGRGNVLASSGPCFVRVPNNSPTRIPILGIMKFDTADLDNLSPAQLKAVVTHEMAHVLGYGTVWDSETLLADPTCPGSPPVCSGGHDTHFTGSQALAAFNQVGGATYQASLKVPVETTGGVGTADAHWRESVFDNELMTGFVDVGENPLSIVSVSSMQDLGYTVSLQGADPYTLPPPSSLAQARRGPPLELGNDVLRIPIHVVDQAGRVLQIMQP